MTRMEKTQILWFRSRYFIKKKRKITKKKKKNIEN